MVLKMLIQKARGGKRTAIPALTAATTTSEQQEMQGHNALVLFAEITGTGTWTVKIQGASERNGTYMDLQDERGDAMALASATASIAQVFIGIPDDFRIVATEDVNGATIQVDYKLMTL